MKKILVILVMCMSMSLEANAQSKNVEITSVQCDYNPHDNTYTQVVHIALTQKAIRELNETGLTKYVVKVKPKNSVFSFFIDLRDAETVVLTKTRPYNVVYFKSYRKCTNDNFIAETPWGPSK